MKTVNVLIQGLSPLLQHRMTEDEIQSLMPGASKRKATTKRQNETRTPRELAAERLYVVEGMLCHPSKAIIGAASAAGKGYKDPGAGVSRATCARLVHAACRIHDEWISILTRDNALANPQRGWEVDIGTAVNGNAGKGTRVVVIRPRFDQWRMTFTLSVEEDLMPVQLVHEILEKAGRTQGIGSYRPQNSGPYGRFGVIQWDEISEAQAAE